MADFIKNVFGGAKSEEPAPQASADSGEYLACFQLDLGLRAVSYMTNATNMLDGRGYCWLTQLLA